MANLLYEQGRDDDSFRLAFKLYVWAFNYNNTNKNVKFKIKMMLCKYDFEETKLVADQIKQDSRFMDPKPTPAPLSGICSYSLLHFYWAGSHPKLAASRNLGRWSRQYWKTDFVQILWCNNSAFKAIQNAERNKVRDVDPSLLPDDKQPSLTYFLNKTKLPNTRDHIFWWESEADHDTKKELKRVFSRKFLVVNLESWFTSMIKQSENINFKANASLILELYPKLNDAGCFQIAKDHIMMFITRFMSGMYFDIGYQPGKETPKRLNILAQSIANDPETGEYFLTVQSSAFNALRVAYSGKHLTINDAHEDVNIWISFYERDFLDDPKALKVTISEKTGLYTELKKTQALKKLIAADIDFYYYDNAGSELHQFDKDRRASASHWMQKFKETPNKMLHHLRFLTGFPGSFHTIYKLKKENTSLMTLAPSAINLYRKAIHANFPMEINCVKTHERISSIRIFEYFLAPLVQELQHLDKRSSLYCTPFQRLQALKGAVKTIEKYRKRSITASKS